MSKINNDVYELVPLEEQERLSTIISTIYHGLKTVDQLVKEGVLPGHSEHSDITLAQLKFRFATAYAYETTDDDNWWTSYGSTLAQVWSIALIEPTPVGEAVAVVISGVVVVYLAATRADCIDRYYDCVMYGSSSNCSDCLHYCIAQGNWNCN